MYGTRFYRAWIDNKRLVNFTLTHKKADILVLAKSDLCEKARAHLEALYTQIERYGKENPEFLKSLIPCAVAEQAPGIVRIMHEAALRAGVGPMASVAGAIAEELGRFLLPSSDEVIVENGGDIFIAVKNDARVGVYSGENPPYKDLTIKIAKNSMPCGIATSSGAIGHSLSFGRADAVTVIAGSAAVADAVATRIANRIKTHADLEAALRFAQGFDYVIGCVVIIGQKVGFCGTIELA